MRLAAFLLSMALISGCAGHDMKESIYNSLRMRNQAQSIPATDAPPAPPSTYEKYRKDSDQDKK